MIGCCACGDKGLRAVRTYGAIPPTPLARVPPVYEATGGYAAPSPCLSPALTHALHLCCADCLTDFRGYTNKDFIEKQQGAITISPANVKNQSKITLCQSGLKLTTFSIFFSIKYIFKLLKSLKIIPLHYNTQVHTKMYDTH